MLVCPNVCVYGGLFVPVFVWMDVCLSQCLCICVFFCPMFVPMFVYMGVCLTQCLCVWVFVDPSVRPSVSLSTVCCQQTWNEATCVLSLCHTRSRSPYSLCIHPSTKPPSDAVSTERPFCGRWFSQIAPLFLTIVPCNHGVTDSTRSIPVMICIESYVWSSMNLTCHYIFY